MRWKLPLAAKNYHFPQTFMVGQMWEACHPRLSHPHVDDLIPKKAGYERTAGWHIGVAIPGISSSWSDTALFSWTLRPFQLPCTKEGVNALPPTLVLFEPWGRIVKTYTISFLQWYLHQTRPHIKTSMATWFSRIPAASAKWAPCEGCESVEISLLPLGESDGWIHRIDRWKNPALRWATLLSCCFGCVDQNPLCNNIDKEKKRAAFKDIDGVFIGGVWVVLQFFFTTWYRSSFAFGIVCG